MRHKLAEGQKQAKLSNERVLAERKSQEATAAKAEAHARQLAADARVETQNDPALAILLAGAAAREPEER